MKGSEVRRIRKALGLTQVQLAERLGVNANTVARWERDEMVMHASADRLLRLLAPKARKGRRH